jgi:hypothetical protein
MVSSARSICTTRCRRRGSSYFPGSRKFWISTETGDSATTVIPRMRSTARRISSRWATVSPFRDETRTWSWPVM